MLKISKKLSPVKVNVLPLIKNRHSEKAKEVYQLLRKHMMASYDEAGTIGKRYRRCDAIGTPFAVTIDDETLEKGLVTIRDRDTMGQKAVELENVLEELKKMLEN